MFGSSSSIRAIELETCDITPGKSRIVDIENQREPLARCVLHKAAYTLA